MHVSLKKTMRVNKMLANVVLFWGTSDYINVLFQHNDITTSNARVF